ATPWTRAELRGSWNTPALRPLHIEANIERLNVVEGPLWIESPSEPRSTSHQCAYIVHMRLQLFPFNTRLSPVLKLLCHPLVGSADAGMILRQVDTEMLADEKDQPGESRLFGQRDFERSPEQSWHVERGIHPPKLIQSIRMDTGTGAMRITPVEWICGRQ